MAIFKIRIVLHNVPNHSQPVYVQLHDGMEKLCVAHRRLLRCARITHRYVPQAGVGRQGRGEAVDQLNARFGRNTLTFGRTSNRVYGCSAATCSAAVPRLEV
jgi:hypothetical protein